MDSKLLAQLTLAAAAFAGLFGLKDRIEQEQRAMIINAATSLTPEEAVDIRLSEKEFKQLFGVFHDAIARKKALQIWEKKVSRIVQVNPVIFPKIISEYKELPNKDILLKPELAEPLKAELKELYDAVFADFEKLSDMAKELHQGGVSGESLERLLGATMGLMEHMLKRIKLYENTLFSSN